MPRPFVLCCCLAILAFAEPGRPALAQETPDALPPDSAATTRLAPEQRQMLATVARNAATATQLGTIGGSRGDGDLADLSRAMAATNNGVVRRLAALAGPENLPLRERVDQAAITRMQILAGNDRKALGHELVAWITSHYPDTIHNLEALGARDRRYGALAQAALPDLREQLAAAQQLAQAAMESGTPPANPH